MAIEIAAMAFIGLKWWQHGIAILLMMNNIASSPAESGGSSLIIGSFIGGYAFVWIAVRVIRAGLSTDNTERAASVE